MALHALFTRKWENCTPPPQRAHKVGLEPRPAWPLGLWVMGGLRGKVGGPMRGPRRGWPQGPGRLAWPCAHPGASGAALPPPPCISVPTFGKIKYMKINSMGEAVQRKMLPQNWATLVGYHKGYSPILQFQPGKENKTMEIEKTKQSKKYIAQWNEMPKIFRALPQNAGAKAPPPPWHVGLLWAREEPAGKSAQECPPPYIIPTQNSQYPFPFGEFQGSWLTHKTPPFSCQ